MDIFLGVDCGATNLRIGVFDEQGRLLLWNKVASPLKTQPERFGQVVLELLNTLVLPHTDWTVRALGVGTPGPLDPKRELILPSANLGNTAPIPLLSQFNSLFNFKIYFDRDTNLALLGESWQGAATGDKDVVMLTLGSGVGGAIMIDGQLETGAYGKAGEIGHMIMEVQSSKFKIQNLPICGLGHEGCLEAWINSAKSLDELAQYLGFGLANIVDIFNPQKIIIGGGKINIGNFLPKAVEIMKTRGMKRAVDEVQVVYAKLKDNSGIYGGARMAMIHNQYHI